MTARKFTRKELLRQDEFLTSMEKTQQFWEDYRNAVLIVAASVVVVVVLIIGGISFFKAREARGAAALTEALRPFHGSVLGQQTSPRADAGQMQFASRSEKYEEAIAALDGVVDSYGGTEAGKVARLYRAHALFNLGRYAEAREAYESFRRDAGHGYLSGLALLNVAHCRKIEGDLAGAAAACRELVDSAARLKFPLDAALSALADVRLENGEEEAAATLYRRIVDEFPESAYRFVAEEKLAGLGEQPVAGDAPAME